MSARDVTEKEIRDVKRLQEKANTEAENLAREAKNKVLAAKDLSESQRDKALAEIEARKNAQIQVNKETAKLEAETKDPFDNPVYSTQYEKLSKEIDGATPNVIDRATNFTMEKADDLRAAVGASRSISEGVAKFDVSNPNNKEALKEYRNKVVYDPFDGNYKYIVFDKDTKQYDVKEYETIEEVKIAFADGDSSASKGGNVDQKTEEEKKQAIKDRYGFLLEEEIDKLQEKSKDIPIGGTGA
jgi:hypothetical protein